MDFRSMEDMILKCSGEEVRGPIKDNIREFIKNKNPNLVFRGISSSMSDSEYTEALTIVGEKGNYFREQELVNDSRENQVVTKDEFIKQDLESHSRNPGSLSKYVSTSKNFDIAKKFAVAKKRSHKDNAYIIIAYINTIDDKGQYHEVTRSSSDFADEEKEVLFLHSIFANRIIGVFSQNISEEFCTLNINPSLYKQSLDSTPEDIEVNQAEFEKYKNKLNYQYETWK